MVNYFFYYRMFEVAILSGMSGIVTNLRKFAKTSEKLISSIDDVRKMPS